VFENRVLVILVGPKRDEVTREWIKLHKVELNDLYSLLNIFLVVTSRKIIWVGRHVQGMGKGEVSIGFW
jgi:hypothetical protein